MQSDDVVLPADHSAMSGWFQDEKARALAKFERQYLRDILKLYGGNISHAAKAAQKNRRVFWELLRKLPFFISRPVL